MHYQLKFFSSIIALCLILILCSWSDWAVAATVPKITEGIVVETMDSGGYTYLYFENEGQERWAAMPKTEIKVGQQVELGLGTEMGQYTSNSLGRTFDSIYFCGGLANSAVSLPHPLPESGEVIKPTSTSMRPVSMPAAHQVIANGKPEKTLPPTATIIGEVAETFDVGGYTYVAITRQGQRTWVAAPQVKLVVGQDVSFKSGFVMNNFTSKSLDRSFDTIVFTSGLASDPVSTVGTASQSRD